MPTNGHRPGERFLPENTGQIRAEHLHRYMLCAPLADGAEVLDVASGEGYGSSLLARRATSVVGIDVDEFAVNSARRKYASRNLRFLQGSASALPIPDRSIDLITSFETIEHLEEQEAMLDEFARVLRSEGVLVISSPNKRQYSDLANFSNPYHVRELYFDEFDRLLRDRFAHISYFGQRFASGSFVYGIGRERSRQIELIDQPGAAFEGDPTALMAPVYFIAACSAGVRSQTLAVSLFMDDSPLGIESVAAPEESAAPVLAADPMLRRFALIADATYAELAADRRAETVDAAPLADATPLVGRVRAMLDRVSGAEVTAESLIASNSAVVVDGWAVESRSGAAARGIVVEIAGVRRRALVGFPSADLGAIFGQAATHAGFRSVVPMRAIPAGRQHLRIEAIDERGQSALIDERVLYVLPEGPAQASAWVFVESDPLGEGTQPTIAFRGWAYDREAGRRFSAVAVVIDDTLVIPASYRESRPDVALALGISEDALGVAASVRWEILTPGSHIAKIVAIRETGEVYESGSRYEFSVPDIAHAALA